jgi:putative ABC transport system ATP-binding protein
VLPLSIAGRKPDRAWLDTLIAAVGLGDRRTHRPASSPAASSSASPCARALINRPRVVFADEPTGQPRLALVGRRARAAAPRVDEFGQTVVMVTHDQAAAAAADRVVELADGLIVADRPVRAAA